MSGEPDNHSQHCMLLLRRRDVDRYLAILFLPQPLRREVAALNAFDAEISHIRDAIKDPMMGEVRMQWWREVIGGERGGEAASNPVAAELLKVIELHKLPIKSFENYLDARLFDLYNDPMTDTNSLEGYAGETASALFYLAAMIAGAEKTSIIADCAGHAGVVWLIITILKALPLHRARQQCYIPADVMRAAGATIEPYIAGERSSENTSMISTLTILAREHLTRFMKASRSQPNDVRSIFLPLSLAKPYLKRIDRAGAAALTEPVDFAQWRKQIYLWRSARNGEFG